MALIICPECGKKVSTEAKICPSCVYPAAEGAIPTPPCRPQIWPAR